MRKRPTDAEIEKLQRAVAAGWALRNAIEAERQSRAGASWALPLDETIAATDAAFADFTGLVLPELRPPKSRDSQEHQT